MKLKYLKTKLKVLHTQNLLFIYFALILSLPLKAQIVEKFEHHIHNFNDQTLPYRLFIPEGYSDTTLYPIILTLHGAGERGTDNEKQISGHPLATSWGQPQNQDKNPCFIVSPQCPQNSSWQNHPQALNNLLDSLIDKYSIDTNRLYITGLSMGGFGTFRMLKDYPNKFAAAIPMSGGWGFEDILNFKHISPIWNFHGDIDGIVSVFWSRTVFHALDSIGIYAIYPEDLTEETFNFYLENNIKHLYSEYKGGGHEIWAKAYSDSQMINWVFRQRLNSQDYQNKFAFKVFPNKFFVSVVQDTILLNAKINNPNNNQVSAFAHITNESGSYNDSIPLFDDGNHFDKNKNDGLFSNHFPSPNFEDFFKVNISTIDTDSNNHYLSTPSFTEFTTVGPVKLGKFNIVKIDSGTNIYRGELQIVLTNNSSSKTITNVTAHILDYSPKDIKNINRNPIYKFDNIEPGETVASHNNLKFFFYKDTTMSFVLSIESDGRHFWTDTLNITDIFNIVSVESIDQNLFEFRLNQNYPNPFNPSTTISYSLPKKDYVSIKIYNNLGQLVTTLFDGIKNAGNHNVQWDSKNLSSGVYFHTIKTANFTATKKMILLR